jgi:replication initiator protein RepSA
MADLIGVVNRPDHAEWMRQVERIGGCAHPVHLKGFTRERDTVTGEVVREFTTRDLPGGVMLVRCGNRRASRCPSCAYIYQGDVYQLVRAGMDGGKGVPESVSSHPRVFATLTAPSFGPVHTHHSTTGSPQVKPCHPRRTVECDHARATSCFARHGDDDPVVGTPLCADCYDYTGAVIWQASVGKLWERFCIYLRRHLAKVSGRTPAQVRAEVRLSYVKIVEYQRRGLVHIHAVIRADGIPPQTTEDDSDAPPTVVAPPAWVTAGLLSDAVASAVRAVRVHVDGGDVGYWSFGWGTELDVHDITTRPGEDQAGKVAAYVAKYATKGTEVTGWESWHGAKDARGQHAEMMVATAFALCEVPELAALKLGRWGRELAYRGHVSSKSRRYSTTLTNLRQARADYQAVRARSAPSGSGAAADPQGFGRLSVGTEPNEVDRESFWELAGFGYSVGEALLAADVARDVETNRAAAREAGGARAWVVAGGTAER